MNSRRQFLRLSSRFLTGLGVLLLPLPQWIGQTPGMDRKTVLPGGTRRRDLIHLNPASIDATNLEITPLKDFRTMGETDQAITLGAWRLEVTGCINKPLALSYPDILALPSVEKKVLLICPGWFANVGVWKGIKMDTILEQAGIDPGVTHVVFSGPDIGYEQGKRFPIEALRDRKVFAAYAVNGAPLPKKHGFPLRIVAEGYYGDDWVKYVNRMTLK
jgi:DMSO/TMAO reductase YedYZ molybdopterin-dependent catalytic subunit